MLARQAKEIARQWVMEEGASTPGFRGAFFHGSINWLPDDACLPPTSDVDVLLVLEGAVPPRKPGKRLYRGVIVDAAYLPAEEIRSAEQVLGVSHLAGSLRAAGIIADPSGQLRRVQAGVAEGYARREWVARRCEHAASKARAHLAGLEEAAPFHDQVIAWLFGAGVAAHILLAAGLKNPTVRRRYLDARELLAEHERQDVYERLLGLLGCERMARAQAEGHLRAMESAFDAASAVIRSPFPFAGDIGEAGRAAASGGSRELIERGDHREAVFWMAVTYSRCMKVLAEDGTPELFERHDPGYRALLVDLGIRGCTDLRQRGDEVLAALPGLMEAAEAIMASRDRTRGDT